LAGTRSRKRGSCLMRLNKIVATVCLLLPSVEVAQSTASRVPQLIPRTRREREQNYENLHRVFLSVQVTTPSGQAADNLKQSDFNLFVDHQRHEMSSFQSETKDSVTTPVRVVLVVDALNNSSGRVASYRKAITKYVQSGSGSLSNPTSIAVLSEHGTALSSFSTDRVAVLRYLDELSGNIQTMSCRDTTYERAQESYDRDPNPRLECLDRLFNSSIAALNSIGESLVLSRSKLHRPVRTIIIWLGRGWPLLNEPGFMPDTPEIEESFHRNFVSISGALTEAQVTLNAVASNALIPLSGKKLANSYFVQGVPADKEAVAAGLSLQAFAWQSGGIVLNSTKDITAQIAGCVADAQTYYLLSFDYSPAPKFGERHLLDVRVGISGLATRTRTLYYAEQ